MNKQDKEGWHHFFLVRKKLSFITGLADSSSWAYKCCIVLLYLTYASFFVMACATIAIMPYDKELTVKTLHVITLLIWAMSVVALRHAMAGSLRTVAGRIASGVYSYDEESPDPAAGEIRRSGLRSLRSRSALMARLFLFSGVTNVVVYPLTQLMVVGEDASSSPLNPYLHQPLYMPFDTRTVPGYAAGALLNLIYSLEVYGVGTVIGDFYISYTTVLVTHLKLLNHSLRNIESRAYRLYSKDAGTLPREHLALQPGYRDCLFRCLRANIQHHLAIKELKNVCRVYIGSTFLVLMSTVAMVLATTIALLLEEVPPNKFVNYLLTGISEIVYPFMMCYFGEDVIQESTKIFTALYESPWYEGDKRMKSLLLMMAANVRVPMGIKTTFFNFTASLTTFGDIISNMYRIINLIRRK